MYLTDEDAPSLFSVHQADARGDPKGGGDGRKDGDGDVQDFLPDFLFIHNSLVFI